MVTIGFPGFHHLFHRNLDFGHFTRNRAMMGFSIFIDSM